jgi:hypothetical protein
MSMMKVVPMNPLRQREEDPLNLRSLPMAEPREDGWPAIERALRQETTRQRRLRTGGGLLAVAASALLAFGLLVDRPFHEQKPPQPDQTAPVARAEPEPLPLQEPPLEAMIAMSRQLENRIRLYRREAGDLPSDVLVYQVELQDLIVQVDEELSMNPDSVALWGQRVNLLMDVTRLYENSLRRDYAAMASL